MSPKQRSRVQTPYGSALDLPPPFRPVALREVGDAFGHACANAAGLGAGTLVFVGRFDLVEFAVVLEPEEPLVTARRAFYAGMVALGDALAALAPPEKPIAIEWPDTIRVDGGLIGGGQLAWPDDANENAPPPWLVFGAMIRTVSMTGEESGLRPLATALEEEGFGDAGSERLIEGFARHLMVAMDLWQEKGFDFVGRDYVSRLESAAGVRYSLENNGDLLVRRIGKPVERRALTPSLVAPSWLDSQTGGPRK
jgi:biotin-(acetyl-CoA carboxylase) ligase